MSSDVIVLAYKEVLPIDGQPKVNTLQKITAFHGRAVIFFVKSCKQDLQLLPLGGRRSLIFEDDFENYAHNTDYCRKAELLPCRFYSLERMVTLLPCTH